MYEAAAATSFSRAYLYKLAKDGKLNLVKVGRRTIVTAQELERFLSVGAE